ncbi:hypothetical protein KA005_55955, partial [bacterium]|nr:hypothetical protein [bacterium]
VEGACPERREFTLSVACPERSRMGRMGRRDAIRKRHSQQSPKCKRGVIVRRPKANAAIILNFKFW